MKIAPVVLPFRVDAATLFSSYKPEDDGPNLNELWLEGIKKQARDNLDSGFESLRISWQFRWKKPRHERFEDYTPEEIVLEHWEMHYFEHPDSIEMKGIYKRKNKKTGYSYYNSGDPLIDQLEAAFGRGELPDLSVLNNVSKGSGKDIFREKVFQHTQSFSPAGIKVGDMVAPRSGDQGVQTTPEGEKITASGAKIKHDDYRSDEWLKEMLLEDKELAGLMERFNAGK